MNIDFGSQSQEALLTLVNTVMPFGKYAGTKLLNLPEPYLVWFHKQGFPSGQLGEQLASMYEIKLNGLEPLLTPLLYENRNAGRAAFSNSEDIETIKTRDKNRY
ncbi:hypothetical protein GPAL_3601 [Glaciecola pallidula DSM 14239 = ACAM 615]|jgi:uncharacterized protein (DUF3820 family)|uniref:Cytoplasmic protein n=1 Tax=Brumicola pallidula DSM 14239 = ACAM 615 TaxID=1121922 RepID=K6ZNI0_9ALTE|nr:DUF3820 family protein [Glaciecola pallidula]GAC30443.1 hypothetical protein GPAL_3601 [Glaciecola pallidula DSM 14239 = ACAM 615]